MRILKIAAYFLLLVIMLIPVSAGCQTNPIEAVSICTEVSKDGEPITVVSTLPPDASDIYCSIKLASPSEKSNVKVEWYIVKSEDGQYRDYMIGNETIPAKTAYVVFGFVRSDRLLPAGSYQVKIYYDDRYMLSVPFSVSGKAAEPVVIISDAVMCTSLDLIAGKPLDKTDTFPSDSSVIYCVIRVTGASFGTNIKARWTYIEGELEGINNKVIYTASTRVEGREYISFSIGRSGGKNFPAGSYEVVIMVEDIEKESLRFKVVDKSAIPGPFISEAVTFAYADEQKTRVNITGKFAATVREIGLSARAYNVPAGTELVIRWIIKRSDDAIYADQLLKEDRGSIEGSAPIIAELKPRDGEFIKGEYLVMIVMNGREMATLQFRVQ